MCNAEGKQTLQRGMNYRLNPTYSVILMSQRSNAPYKDKIYICSSDDWSAEGLCVPDFKLTSTIENYKNSDFTQGKYQNIKAKEDIFVKDLNGLNTKLILVADNPEGPYTLIEGCKRSVALSKLDKLVGSQVYVGVSLGIKTYIWARYMYG